MTPAWRLPGPPWALDTDTVEAVLETDHWVGLTSAQVSARQRHRRVNPLRFGGRVLSWSWLTTWRYVLLVGALAGLAWTVGSTHVAGALVFLAAAKVLLRATLGWVVLRALTEKSRHGARRWWWCCVTGWRFASPPIHWWWATWCASVRVRCCGSMFVSST
jgi:hypothetical protein